MSFGKRIFVDDRFDRTSRWHLCLILAMVGFASATSVADDATALQPVEAVGTWQTDAGSPIIGAASPESGFWFLNTHDSVQTFRQTGPVFRPKVCRYETGQGYRSSSYQEMLSSLEPGVPICIMVHGSFVDTPSATKESCYTYHWLRSAAGNDRMQMIYFHWPSYRCLSPLIQLDTNQLGMQAARNGFYLTELIAQLPPGNPVSILGHSHGSRVASSALHLMSGGVVQGYRHAHPGTNGRRIRTVFFAGAIDHHWLTPGQKYDLALNSTQGILNMKNRGDPALAIYPLRVPLFTRCPIGSVGMTYRDRLQIGPQSQKVLDFDVSQAIGHSHLWPHYFRSHRIAMSIRNYVYFPDLQFAEAGQPFETTTTAQKP